MKDKNEYYKICLTFDRWNNVAIDRGMVKILFLNWIWGQIDDREALALAKFWKNNDEEYRRSQL